ncbi:hypothetical protein PIB30_100284, partial [Stylosanthes scabra]|nr:hypothetical protein [Stylosanthes scabra]
MFPTSKRGPPEETVWNGLTWRSKRPQPLLEGDKGEWFRAVPNEPVEWSLKAGILMDVLDYIIVFITRSRSNKDATTKKPPKHPRVSSLQIGTLGGCWPVNISRGLTTSPMRPSYSRTLARQTGLLPQTLLCWFL